MRREDKKRIKDIGKAILMYFMAILYILAFCSVAVFFAVTPFNIIFARRLHEMFTIPIFKREDR